MIVLASDHLIGEPEVFRGIVSNACSEAIANNSIVTLGIKPTYPETGYGYIETDKNCRLGQIYNVKRFLEKPTIEKANEYVEAGNYLWNSGMFIFRAETILDELKLHMPNHYDTLQKINKKIENGLVKSELARATSDYFVEFDKISIDFGVMEKTERIKVIPSSFKWNDIGSFNAFRDVFDPDSNGNLARNSILKQVDASNNTIVTDGCEVGIIGVEDLVIVQTEGKLLVCHKDRVQDIKKII